MLTLLVAIVEVLKDSSFYFYLGLDYLLYKGYKSILLFFYFYSFLGYLLILLIYKANTKSILYILGTLL